MRLTKSVRCLSVLAGLAASLPMNAQAEPASGAPVTVPVILPLSGGAAFLGVGEQKTLQALEQMVNKEGGIGGRPLHFAFQDDETSPQTSVQLTSGAISPRPPVIMGSALVAMCNAVAPLLRNGPVDYCLSPAVHPPTGSYMFSTNTSTTDLLEAELRYFRLRGWTRIASISSSDATGQDFENSITQILKLPENASIQMVERARFNQSDVNVGAQIEHIRAANPQVVIAWTTGAPIATVFKGIVQGGLSIPVATTNGNQTYAQMDQYADFLPKDFYIASSLFEPHEGLPSYDPRIEAAQKEFFDTLNAAKLPIDIVAGHSWDPGKLVVAALRKVGPNGTAQQVKEFLDNQTDFAGVNGIYDFKKVPQRGLDVGSAVMTRWDGAKRAWIVVSKPAGVPLTP